MTINGNKAQVFVNGRWSKWMLISEAETFEHTQKVARYLELLRSGQPIIGLVKDIRAIEEAKAQYTKERKGALNTLPSAE